MRDCSLDASTYRLKLRGDLSGQVRRLRRAVQAHQAVDADLAKMSGGVGSPELEQHPPTGQHYCQRFAVVAAARGVARVVALRAGDMLALATGFEGRPGAREDGPAALRA